ncbi:G patch domain-containing protein 1-like [Stylophora pistillata]|uniref:G patch domain-containing protein 1-like n=1 Tax=Stylophora pistillata TaxID=50429 RepID=UPI000C04B2B9|nr:G patch domain-containing protein 1-like [Stylophora pistillata]
MADSDDDTLASFGTPFEPLEEDAPRKKATPIHDQIVTDTEGRRRFHGAFTGGFSAGYFNTVGTKEGWQPSTFVSSRSKKGEQRQQRPEDLMDDDDMGEFGIAPKRIATKEQFLSWERGLENRRKRMVTSDDSERVIPGVPPLQDLVVPVKMSVGVELLKKMGWKEGQGVGPRERRARKKVYGCSLPSALTSLQTTDNDEDEEEDIFAVGLLFAPKDVDVFTFTPKDDKHGLGYKGLDPSTALFHQENWLGMDSVSRRPGRKGISGEAFGVGAFEEADDNIYAVDQMSNYDTELGGDTSSGLHGWTGPQKENSRGGALSIFTTRPKATDALKTFSPPVVPRHFDCTHKFDDSKTGQKSSEEGLNKKKVLTATERGEMLGEEPLPAPKKSVFEFLSEEDKKRVLSASKSEISKPSGKIPSKEASSSRNDFSQKSASTFRWSGHSSFKPFVKDPTKQARYEEFLKGKQGEQASPQLHGSGLTEWEREREREEFFRSASLYKPMNSTMAARFTTAKQPDDHRVVYEEVPAQESADSSEQAQAASMKMFGKLTRDNFEWYPDNVLCKRFNIPNPYPESRVVGVPKVRKPKFTLGDFIVPREPRAVTFEHSTSSANNDDKSGSSTETVSGIDRQPKPSDLKSVSSDTLTKTAIAPSIVRASSNSDVLDLRESNDKAHEEENGENSVPKRPGMDLFKAIFADSSSDESEASSDEDEVGKEKGAEDVLITTSENKSPEVASRSHVDERTKENSSRENVSNDKTLYKELRIKPIEREEHRPSEMQIVSVKNNDKERADTSPESFGPALPPSLNKTTSSYSFSEEKRNVDHEKTKEDSDRRRRNDKYKETKKRYSESSDSEEEYRDKHKPRRKSKKKHKHKHRSKHRYEEKERLEPKTKRTDELSKPLEQSRESNDKQILDKLKNLQNLKTGKRMRASDFM